MKGMIETRQCPKCNSEGRGMSHKASRLIGGACVAIGIIQPVVVVAVSGRFHPLYLVFGLFFVVVGVANLAAKPKYRCTNCGNIFKERHGEERAANIIEEKECPNCAEVIKLNAKICRFCKHEFSDEDIAQSKKETEIRQAQEAEQRRIHKLKRKSKACLFYGWFLICLGVLLTVSYIGGVITSSKPIPTAAVVLGIIVWLLPCLFGVLVLRKRNGIKKSLSNDKKKNADRRTKT